MIKATLDGIQANKYTETRNTVSYAVISLVSVLFLLGSPHQPGQVANWATL